MATGPDSTNTDASRTLRPVVAASLACGALALTLVILFWRDIPLGVPGEWEWPRSTASELLAGLDIAGVVAAVTVLGLHSLVIWIAVRNRQLLLPSLMLSVTTFLWLIAVQSLSVSGIAQIKPLWVPYDAAATGYFQQARQIEQPLDFLSGYESTAREGDVLHMGTHPPGITLVHAGLLKLYRSSLGVTQVTLSTLPDSQRTAFRKLERSARQGDRLTEHELAALWSGTLLCWILSACSIMPLAFWLSLTNNGRLNWFVVGMWSFAPAVAIFLPKSDAVFPFISLSILAFTAFASTQRRWPLIIGGGLLWLGLLFSLAFIVVAALVLLMILMDQLRDSDSKWPVRVREAGVQGAVFLTPVVACTFVAWTATGCNMFSVWRINLVKHAGFYAQFERTYSSWLLANPIEQALAIGLPLMAITIYSGMIRIRRLSSWELATLITWGLLLLSGKNMGESARLWIFLSPTWCVIANGTPTTGKAAGTSEHNSQPENRGWWAILVAQAAAAAATLAVVDGFHFGG